MRIKEIQTSTSWMVIEPLVADRRRRYEEEAAAFRLARSAGRGSETLLPPSHANARYAADRPAATVLSSKERQRSLGRLIVRAARTEFGDDAAGTPSGAALK